MAKEFEPRDNSGALFKNDKKTEDKHPEYKGDAKIDGVEYWVSAWIKKSRDGKTFMSLAYTPKDQDNRQSSNVPRSQPRTADSDIPFAWLVPFIGLLVGSGLLA